MLRDMDDFFGAGFVDVDEWRDTPVRHRYVHGGFEGTDTRFSLWFPEASRYQGRFVQFLQGGLGGSEHQGELLGAPAIAFENGAYFVESNQGHIGNDLSGIKGDMTILAYRASAETARLSRRLAAETYGSEPRHGYVFGGSGGAVRGVECLEACPDVWQGAVAFMINRTGLYHYNWSIAAWAGTLLAGKLPRVVDAMDAGGSGNPFEELDRDEERQALAALYRAGFCRGAEPQLEPNPLWVLGMQLLRGNDASYFRDFWTRAGYEGADGDPLVERLRVEHTGSVREVVSARELRGVGFGEDINRNVLARLPGTLAAGIRVDFPVAGRMLGATLRIVSGKAQGRSLLCTGVVDDALVAVLDPVGFAEVAPGDAIELENRDFVAFAFHHRHWVDPRYPAMRQFLVDGKPLHAQRPRSFDRVPVPRGRFEGRLILIQHCTDRECWPNCAEPYVRDVRRNFDARSDEVFRIYWIENAAHLVPLSDAGRTRLIPYSGIYAQAVRDVIAWVEGGAAPPESTRYSLEDEGLLRLPPSAQERRGVQPVVALRANGGPRAEARVGERVELVGSAEAPAGAGNIVLCEWDLDGSGRFALRESRDGESPRAESRVAHAFASPGTHFVTFRAWIHREGESEHALRRIPNLARARIVVGPAD